MIPKQTAKLQEAKEAFHVISPAQEKNIEVISKDVLSGDWKKLVGDLETKHLAGTFAILLGIVSFIPIMYKMWVTKNHSNFTWLNLLLALSSNLLWVYYGIVADTEANMWSGILYFGIYMYIVMFKIFY